ncbi:MAG: replicative DNA helicase [Chloroflexi bacterium]|nr:replicative DNA helicase [Chloroflexota bacterium]
MTDDIYPPEEKVEETVSLVVPHSREAEEAVVGAVLINPEVYYDIAQFLTADDFYIHRNKWIWEAYDRLSEKRIPVDLLTVSEEMEQVNHLAEVGGSAYLTSLINQVPSSLNAESYGRIVEGHSVRRKLLSAANEIASLAYKGMMSAQEAVEEASRKVISISTKKENEAEFFKKCMSAVYDRAEKNAERTAKGESIVTGIKTGLLDLDLLLLGIEKQENVVVAAITGKGKTSLLFDIARHNVLKERKNVAIFSLEMSGEEVARRFIAQESMIESTKIKTGALSPEEWIRFNETIELYENRGQIFLSDIRNLTPVALRAKCLKLQREYGIDLVVVDYLQLMSGGGNFANRALEVAHISRQNKILAGELDIPVISAAQLNRNVEQRAEKRPTLSDLKESSGIEQDANTVIFLHFDEYGKKDFTECIVAKRRDGPVGSVSLKYLKEFTTFRDSAYTD